MTRKLTDAEFRQLVEADALPDRVMLLIVLGAEKEKAMQEQAAATAKMDEDKAEAVNYVETHNWGAYL